jgi:hypothetical protein
MPKLDKFRLHCPAPTATIRITMCFKLPAKVKFHNSRLPVCHIMQNSGSKSRKLDQLLKSVPQWFAVAFNSEELHYLRKLRSRVTLPQRQIKYLRWLSIQSLTSQCNFPLVKLNASQGSRLACAALFYYLYTLATRISTAAA